MQRRKSKMRGSWFIKRAERKRKEAVRRRERRVLGK
jgi:hypothetical protein